MESRSRSPLSLLGPQEVLGERSLLHSHFRRDCCLFCSCSRCSVPSLPPTAPRLLLLPRRSPFLPLGPSHASACLLPALSPRPLLLLLLLFRFCRPGSDLCFLPPPVVSPPAAASPAFLLPRPPSSSAALTSASASASAFLPLPLPPPLLPPLPPAAAASSSSAPASAASASPTFGFPSSSAPPPSFPPAQF